jgi:hypothetical protein
MAKLPLYATGITASFTILLTAAKEQDVALLKQAHQEALSPAARAGRPVPSQPDSIGHMVRTQLPALTQNFLQRFVDYRLARTSLNRRSTLSVIAADTMGSPALRERYLRSPRNQPRMRNLSWR